MGDRGLSLVVLETGQSSVKAQIRLKSVEANLRPSDEDVGVDVEGPAELGGEVVVGGGPGAGGWGALAVAARHAGERHTYSHPMI